MLGVKTPNRGTNMGNKSYQVLNAMGNKSSGSMHNKSSSINNSKSMPIRENESNSANVIYTPLGLKKEPGMKRFNTIEKR
jgi:hypothetical protein